MKIFKTLMIVVPVFAFFAILCAGGADKVSDDENIRILEDHGYYNIQLYDRYLGCGEGDVYRRGFRAQIKSNDKVRNVQGILCRGYNKSSTVRLD